MNLKTGMRSKVQKLRSKIKLWRATEKVEVVKAMKKAKRDKILAAALLGISRTTLYRKLKKFR